MQLQRSQSVDLLLEGTMTRSEKLHAAALRRSSAPTSIQQAMADQWVAAGVRTAANSHSEGRLSTSRSRTGLNSISRRISGSRNSGSEYGRGNDSDTVPVFEVGACSCHPRPLVTSLFEQAADCCALAIIACVLDIGPTQQ